MDFGSTSKDRDDFVDEDFAEDFAAIGDAWAALAEVEDDAPELTGDGGVIRGGATGTDALAATGATAAAGRAGGLSSLNTSSKISSSNSSSPRGPLRCRLRGGSA